MVYFDIKEKCPVHRFEKNRFFLQVQAPEIFEERIFGLANIKGTDKIILQLGRGRGRLVMSAGTLA